MKFTDLFIRRPVLASVISLLILVLGVRAYYALPVLQYPRTENAVVTVTTTYYGADPDVVAGFITTPLEIAIAQAYGIDYMTSTSQSSTSTITIYLRLNYDADKALTEINTKISSVLNQLPTGTQQPVLTVKIGQTIDAMYLGFNSDALAPIRSPTTSRGLCSRSYRPYRACRPRSCSARRCSHCVRGSIRKSSRRSA